MEKESILVPVAMQIILHAGNARTEANHALDCIKTKEFSKAREFIKKAHEEVLLAHKEQTNIIQNEASGKHYESCLLFTHAQDTLMTIMTELNLTEHLIEIFASLEMGKQL